MGSTLQLIWDGSIYQDEVPHCCISSPGSLQRLPPVRCQQASSCSTSASVSSGAQGSLQPGSQDHLRVCDPTGVSRCPDQACADVQERTCQILSLSQPSSPQLSEPAVESTT